MAGFHLLGVWRAMAFFPFVVVGSWSVPVLRGTHRESGRQAMGRCPGQLQQRARMLAAEAGLLPVLCALCTCLRWTLAAVRGRPTETKPAWGHEMRGPRSFIFSSLKQVER